jgi:hypothetical protein
MANPSTIFSEMVSTTMRNVADDMADNISKHNALLNRLKKKGKFINLDGGYEIQIPIEYAENGTYQRFAGYDTLNTNASDVVTSAKYDWCQIAIHVVSSGREILMNSGKAAMKNLVKVKRANALKTAANNFAIDMYSDGSLQNQIGGLANLIQSNGQGTVGGLNSATYPFWRNKFKEMPGTGTYTKDTFKVDGMNPLWLQLVRGADAPDLIVLSHDFYSIFEAGEQQLQRYTNSEMAEAGFISLKYKTADVIFDENTNFSTTAEKGYFLNTDYLQVAQHRDAKWSEDEEKKPINQDAIVRPYYWMGNMTTSNRALQGVLIDAA